MSKAEESPVLAVSDADLLAEDDEFEEFEGEDAGIVNDRLSTVTGTRANYMWVNLKWHSFVFSYWEAIEPG